MLKTSPNPIDVQELQFKQKFRLKVFENTGGSNFPQSCSLISCASRYGLLIIGTNSSNFQVVQLKNIEDYSKNDGDKADYPRRNVPLPSPPSHLSVNCEHSILAVVVEKSGCYCVLFYDVKSFWRQEIAVIGEARLSATPGVHVLETNWNPALGAIFTACKSDGSLGIYEIKNSGIDINEIPSASGATCFCWSPKGKQIAVGSRDGKITQYKPDLKAVKVIGSPPFKEPHKMLSLQWVSNYQFIGIFQASNSEQASLLVIDSPKTGDPTYLNYEDICYSNGNTRPSQFYMILQQNWNILMVASSNSMEVGVLGNVGESWIQWILGDSARAELPLSVDRQETLPIGCDLDIGNTKPIPWGESTLPPAPVLLLLSHFGVLCCFNVINLKEGIPSICSPPDPIHDTSGLQHFTVPNSLKTAKPITNQLLKDSLAKPSAGTIETQEKKAPDLKFLPPQPLNLFGGQATLTPIITEKKSNSASAVPQQYQPIIYPTLSTNESKLIPPQQKTLYPTLPNEDSKVMPTPPKTNSGKLLTIPVVPKPVVTPTPIPTTSQITTSISTSIRQPEVKKELNKTPSVVSESLQMDEEAEKIFAKIVREECIFLESELRALLHQGKSLKINLGTDEDKTTLVESTQSLEEFFKEMTDICSSQNAEVHILKQNLLQSFAWYEEIKSRHVASQDESMLMILKAQPLDSASEKRLDDIRHAKYYLESQIAQAHRVLDEQWESFQDYCKKTHRIQIPTMEMIFQTMVKQTAIVRRQSYILKDIASRLKSKSRSAVGPPLLVSLNDAKELTDELKRLRMNPDDICQIQYEHVLNRKKNFTAQKCADLRNFLKKREYSHVSAVKPQLSTSIIQSPSSKLKQLSLVSNPVVSIESTVSSNNIVKKLDFTPSTPKLANTPATTDMKSSTPIQGLQNFASKFEAQNFNKLSPLTTKNLLAGSPNSAFASTSTTATSTSVSFKPVIFGVPSTSSVKSPPSFVVVTTTPAANQPVITVSSTKPFSFATGQDGLRSPLISTSTSSGGTKPFSFNLQLKDAPTTAPIFGAVDSTSKSTSAPALGLNLTKPLATISNTSSTQAFSLTTKTTSSQLSFGLNTPSTSIFGLTAQKPSEPVTQKSNEPVTSTKPGFGAGPPKTISSTAAAVPQTRAFLPTSSASVSVAATTTSKPPVTSQTIFGTAANTTKPSLFANFGTSSVNSMFGSTTSTAPTLFSSGGTKSPFATSSAPTLPTTIANTPAAGPKEATIVPSGLSSFGTATTTTVTSSVFSSGTSKSFPSTTTAPSVTQTVPIAATSITTSTVATSTSTTTSVQNLFGFQTTTSQPSLFKAPDSTTTTQATVFPSSTSGTGFSFSSTPASKPLFPTTETPDDTNSNKPTLFGSPQTPSSPVPATATEAPSSAAAATSMFGAATPAFSAATISAAPAFGAASTPASSVFGAATTTASPAFANVPTATTSIFGNAATSSAPIFGTPTTSTPSVFGSTTTAKPSIFGVTTTSTTPAFGGPTTTATSSLFGTPTTTSSVFGTPSSTVFGSGATSTAAPQSSIFAPAATTTQSAGFGMFGAAPKTSIFGNASTANVTQSSVFGNSNQSTVFGTTTAAPAQSVFDPPKTTQSVFGQTTAFGSTSSPFGAGPSVFGGTSSSFGQATSTVFGGAATTTAAGIFGGTPTTTFGSSSVFGTPASTTSSPFGSGGVFSSNAPQQSFAANPTPNSFGFGGLNVGSASITSSSVFGATPTANPFAASENKNVFGGAPASSSNSVFGSSGSSIFGNSSQSQGFGSGGFVGGQSVFSQQSSFGSSSFGQQTPGPFSGGSSGTVAQSGFGASPPFQKPGGFGGSPVFGSTPAFGSAPSFGGAPTFGSTGSFGSPPKVFGSGNTGFGAAASTQNAGFGNLANQPTVGFGNLAQQASNANAPNAPFSGGNSSFSSWR